MAKPKPEQRIDGDRVSITFTRPIREDEIERYWRLFTETNVAVSRFEDRDRYPNFVKTSVHFEAIEVIGVGPVFEFTDGKLTGIRRDR